MQMQNIAHTHKLHTPHLLHILHTLQTLHTLQRGKKSEHLNRCWHYRVQKRNLPTKMHIRTCGRIFSTRNISLELQQNLPDLLQDLILDVHGCCCPGWTPCFFCFRISFSPIVLILYSKIEKNARLLCWCFKREASFHFMLFYLCPLPPKKICFLVS